jgi:hypothetical protein
MNAWYEAAMSADSNSKKADRYGRKASSSDLYIRLHNAESFQVPAIIASDQKLPSGPSSFSSSRTGTRTPEPGRPANRDSLADTPIFFRSNLGRHRRWQLSSFFLCFVFLFGVKVMRNKLGFFIVGRSCFSARFTLSSVDYFMAFISHLRTV